MSKFPSDKLLEEVQKKLDKLPGSRPLPSDADPVEKLKYKLCEKFVLFKNENSHLSQVQFANELEIDVALMSKILNYHIDEFTIDSEFIFENFYAEFRGDKRALLKEDLELNKHKEPYVLSKEQSAWIREQRRYVNKSNNLIEIKRRTLLLNKLIYLLGKDWQLIKSKSNKPMAKKGEK